MTFLSNYLYGAQKRVALYGELPDERIYTFNRTKKHSR